MLLEFEEAQQMHRLTAALMWFVSQRLKVVPEPLARPDDFMDLPQASRIKTRAKRGSGTLKTPNDAFP